MVMFELTLDDLQIISEDQPPPAKLIKALAVIADRLHSSWDAIIPKNKSKESCVLCSLTVRDFLRTIGIAARVEPVVFLAIAKRDGKILHSTAVGMPSESAPTNLIMTPNDALSGPTTFVKPGQWNGHLVTIVRDSGWLIDVTLYQAQRPAWPQLPGMIAISLDRDKDRIEWRGMPVLAAIHTHDPDDGNYRFDAGWFLNAGNKSWRSGPDCRNTTLRAPIIGKLIERFGGWEDAA
jgi:hypothetical protein